MNNYVNKLGNVEKMGKFIETYNLPKLNHEQGTNCAELQRTIEEIKAVIKYIPTKT